MAEIPLMILMIGAIVGGLFSVIAETRVGMIVCAIVATLAAFSATAVRIYQQAAVVTP